MNINNHLLTEADAGNMSPNVGGTLADTEPSAIVLHYTGGASRESSVNHLCQSATKASAHLVVGRDEIISQLVPFNTVAWHAGRSRYQGREGYNRLSIGIEIDNPGPLKKRGDRYFTAFSRECAADEVVLATHRQDIDSTLWHRYTDWQVDTVTAICIALMESYPIREIVGHEEIAPSRKRDPGPAFPLDALREMLLGDDRSAEGGDLLHPGRPGLVTVSRLNIRNNPAIDALMAAPPLQGGQVVEIVDERDGWLKVESYVSGWVKQDYIKR
jgi:N-acetylmuramoyl-L-alanine amidase